MKQRSQLRAFSLIELLVVISTVALLLGLLLPSLNMAREQTRRTVCLNNLRQMALAAQSYAAVYDDHYPLAYYNRRIDETTRLFSWDFTSWRQWTDAGAVTQVEPGLLWTGRTIEKIQQCPAFDGAHNAMADPFTGYNYNTSYIGLDDTLSPENSAKTTDVRRPAETALFGDGQSTDGGANKYMRAPFSHPGDTLLPDSARYAGAQGYRHQGQTNAAFCDGHAEPWSEIHTETDPSAKNHLDNYNAKDDVKVGFLTSDNRIYDLK